MAPYHQITFGGRRVETLKTSEILRMIAGQGGGDMVQKCLTDELDKRIPPGFRPDTDATRAKE